MIPNLVKIVARPPRYAALQYTGENGTELAAFIGFLYRPATETAPPAYYDPIGQYFRPIEVGYWVTLVGTTLNVLSEAEFAAAFDIVPN